MQTTTNGRCRLHGGNASLRDSHIIPNWAYKRTRGLGAKNTVAFKGDCLMIDSRHITEHLLCAACEQKLGVWDDYAARMSRKDSGFAALEAAEPEGPLGSVYGASLVGVDIAALAKFGVAVFWRASISSKFPAIKLGRHEDGLRDYLTGETKFPRKARLILQLIQGTPAEPTDQVVIAPWQSANPEGHVLRFSVFGLFYALFLGRNFPPSIDSRCLARTSHVIVGDAPEILLGLSAQIAMAPRKGKLARTMLRFSTL